ncbi:MAG: hypothetical protein IJR99_09990 [Kiritimatiellae bacterium]|nr:hypothetical protein [Kiritimatiellia bacterium]
MNRLLLKLALVAAIVLGCGSFHSAFADTPERNGVTHRLKEGLKSGLKNGMKEGLKHGLKDGTKNGLTNGRKKGQREGQGRRTKRKLGAGKKSK